MIYEKIAIEGDMVFNAPDAKQQIKGALDKKFVEIDLSKVDYMDSSGVDVIAKLAATLKSKNGRLRISGIQEHILDLLKICNLDELIEIVPSFDCSNNIIER